MSSSTYEAFDQISQFAEGETATVPSADPDISKQIENFRPDFARISSDTALHRGRTRPLMRHWSPSLPGHKTPNVDSLDLFHLASRWHLEKEPSAGWELVALLRSSDCDTRAHAAELLARTEYGRVLKRDLRRAKARLRRQTVACRPPQQLCR